MINNGCCLCCSILKLQHKSHLKKKNYVKEPLINKM